MLWAVYQQPQTVTQLDIEICSDLVNWDLLLRTLPLPVCLVPAWCCCKFKCLSVVECSHNIISVFTKHWYDLNLTGLFCSRPAGAGLRQVITCKHIPPSHLCTTTSITPAIFLSSLPPQSSVLQIGIVSKFKTAWRWSWWWASPPTSSPFLQPQVA